MSPFIWLAVAAVMAVVEVVSFGLITMWFVIGALAAFAANLLGADLLVQIVVFLVVSVVCLVALRPVFVKYRDRGKQEEPTHVGQTAVVVEDVDNEGLTGNRQPHDLGRAFRRRLVHPPGRRRAHRGAGEREAHRRKEGVLA